MRYVSRIWRMKLRIKEKKKLFSLFLSLSVIMLQFHLRVHYCVSINTFAAVPWITDVMISPMIERYRRYEGSHDDSEFGWESNVGWNLCVQPGDKRGRGRRHSTFSVKSRLKYHISGMREREHINSNTSRRDTWYITCIAISHCPTIIVGVILCCYVF